METTMQGSGFRVQGSGASHDKDSSILGSILGSPIYGSCHIDKAMGIKLVSIASPGQAVDYDLILARFRV